MATTGATAAPKRRWRVSEQTRWGYIFLLPWIFGFVVFTAGPMIASFYLSFTKYNVIRAPQFIGLRNYELMLDDRRIPLSLLNTAFYALLHVPGVIIFSLLLAMLLLRVGRASGAFRTAFYLPNVTPAVAVGTLFLLLLSGNGLINQVLGAFGIDGPNWLTDPTWVKPGIVLMSWWTLGATVVIFFAALRNVPVELYEAAQIDGANARQRFRLIVVPFIKPILLIVTVLQVIWDLRVFTQIFALQDIGGIRALTNTLGVYIYQTSIAGGDFGQGGAIAVITAILLMSISIYYVRQVTKEEEL